MEVGDFEPCDKKKKQAGPSEGLGKEGWGAREESGKRRKKKRGNAGEKQRSQEDPACVVPTPTGLARHTEDDVGGVTENAECEGQLDRAKKEIALLASKQNHAGQDDGKHMPSGVGEIASQTNGNGGMGLDQAADGLEDAEEVEIGGEVASPQQEINGKTDLAPAKRRS